MILLNEKGNIVENIQEATKISEKVLDIESYAKEYEQLDKIIKEKTKKIDLVKTVIREKSKEIFSDPFSSLTKILECDKFNVIVSKDSIRETITFDKDGFIEELLTSQPELLVIVNKLKEKYTSTKTSSVAPTIKVIKK